MSSPTVTRSLSGTLSPESVSGLGFVSLIAPFQVERDQQQYGADADGGVGHVEDRPAARPDPDVEEIVGVFASQTAKTEAILNVLGFYADDDPSEVPFYPLTMRRRP